MAKIFPPQLPSPNLYRSVARNESLFIDMIDMRFIGPMGLMDRKTIPPRIREIMILRTCVQAQNDYEFNLHVKTISEKVGLSKAEIKDLKNTRIDDNLWPADESSLIALTDELVKTTSVSDEVFERASKHFSDAELIEMVQLVGLYTTVAMLVSLIRPELDPY
jgi:alkylhydroperoxidase family enzyme